jgi:hypothetical protein
MKAARVLLMLLTLLPLAARAGGEPPLPQHLRDTGFGAPGAIAFTPQYPLWSDGAAKRRWLALPPGRAIDARQPDAWQFPPGTKLWKEFAHAGRPVETRYIERLADGRWRFASYLWNDDGSDAVLAPEAGVAALPVAAAPGGRYAVPSRNDCRACHESSAVPVLGASALQLAPELPAWAERGWLRGLPAALRQTPPAVAAASDTERAALGALHANCGHCHNRSGHQVPLALTLAQRAADPAASRAEVLHSLLEAPTRLRAQPPVRAGHAADSVLVQRMASRAPALQMPPLGTRIPDLEALALVQRWIDDDLINPKEPMK